MRAVIIGLDGMPYRLIADLAEREVMPNMRALIAEGAFREMDSSIPEVSSVAWSSIITGKNPGEHGIFGFTDLSPGSYRLTFPSFADLKAAPFWEREGSGRAAIINVPSTYPAAARAMNGVLISGFVALKLEKAVYPPSLAPELERLDYRLDVDSGLAHRSLELFLEDLQRTLASHIAACRWLWEKEEWETFMIVFTTTDRLAHFLWEAYEDEGHPYHSAFLDHLRKIDQAIGELAAGLDRRDLLIALSDHGFERLEEEVHVNLILKEEGFLELEEAPSAPDLEAISSKTKAFALDPARIYINLRGRFPRGSVEPKDKERVIAELLDLFAGLELHGRRVVRRACRKEEIYHGPWLEWAPDLVLLPERGFTFRARLEFAAQAGGASHFTGKHAQEGAFLLVKGEGAQEVLPPNLKPGVADVVGLIDRLRQSER
jgi:predicted AlkP superfamily phosphohydrolase/phosphomutase